MCRSETTWQKHFGYLERLLRLSKLSIARHADDRRPCARSGLFTTRMTSAVYRFTVHTNVMRYWAVGDHYLPVLDTR